MSSIWFTADLHFDHNSILYHCNRPFSNLDTMNIALLYEIIKTVKRRDVVYVIGDFIWKRRLISMYFKNLPGKWILVPGNHDEKFKNEYSKYCKVTERLHHFNFNKRLFVLCHYPLDTWNKSHYDSIHLHGHSHGTLGTKRKNRFDIGWDVHKRLINLNEILSWSENVQQEKIC